MTGRDGNVIIKKKEYWILDLVDQLMKSFFPYSDTEFISLFFKSGGPKTFMINNNTGRINELCLKES